ncbi:hypothetical protein [Parabacteroides sp.]
MNIYVYMIALGMIIICLSYYWWVDKRDRKQKDDLERQYRDHYIE